MIAPSHAGERRTQFHAAANKVLRSIHAILARIANKRILLYETVSSNLPIKKMASAEELLSE